jgi:hypothetical protein
MYSKIISIASWLKYLYKTITSLNTNYRNNFTKEYYDYLINTANKEQLINEVKKYNSKSYKTAEYIITYTNTTREIYNNLMLEDLKLKHGDVKSKVVCKTNNLSDLDIYNNFYYTITDKDEEYIYMTDDVTDYKITHKQFNHKHSNGTAYFEPGYCRTLYNIQGESLQSFYYAEDDFKFLSHRATYTLISRLKTK